MTLQELGTKTLTTCNGKIDPANGLCDKCYQPAQTTSSICGRLIVSDPEPPKPTLDNEMWKLIQATPHFSSNPEDYIKPFRDLISSHVETLQKENESLKDSNKVLRRQWEVDQQDMMELTAERDKLKSENEKLEAEMVRNNLDSFEGYKQMQSEIDSLKEQIAYLEREYQNKAH